MIIRLYKKSDRKDYANYKEYHFLVFEESCIPSALKKCSKIVESKLEDCWCGFRPGRNTTV